MSQERLAERAGTSQQWVSRVERGEVDLRLGDAERLFGVTGARLVVRTAGAFDAPAEDPDLLPVGADAAEALELAVGAHGYLWKVFRAVPFLVGGRIGALAQGLRVRPLGLDLVIAEGSVEVANRAMGMMNVVRWSERHQDWVGYDSDIDGFGPRRWWMRTGSELRIEVVPELGAALSVTVDGRELRVVPLVSLIRDDPDVAELARRLAAG